MAKIRDLSRRDEFLEGNREKWAVIFLGCAGLIMVAQVFWHIDPTPYLTLITFIGSFLIGGATITEFVKTKAFSASSESNTQYTRVEQEIDINQDIKEVVIEEGAPEAPSVKPFSQIDNLE